MTLRLMQVIAFLIPLTPEYRTQILNPDKSTQSVSVLKRFEAAFQGECRDEVPCQQLCYDLHDGTFECGCKPSYSLFTDGYSCIEIVEDNVLNRTDERLKERHIFRYVLNSKEQLPAQEARYVLDKGRHDPRARTLSQSEKHSSGEFDEENLKSQIRFTEVEKSPPGRSTPLAMKTWQEAIGSADELKQSGYFTKTENNSVDPMPIRASSRALLKEASCRCSNGGISVYGTEMSRCSCTIGQSYEKAEEIRYPRFMGSSYLILHPSGIDRGQDVQIELEFRPDLYEGLLLSFNSSEEPKEALCTVVLRNGIVQVRHSNGEKNGFLRSEHAVVLNSWNRVKLTFNNLKSSIQLNEENIRNKLPMGKVWNKKLVLFVGGFPDMPTAAIPNGFQGCVRRLEINNHSYAFHKKSNDIVRGFNIKECQPGVCNTVSCQNGGQCAAVRPNWGRCLCPLGFAGDQCTDTIEISVPSFDGTGHLQFPGLASSSLTFTEILLVFLPRSPDGALLYNGYRINGTGDFLSLTLSSGYILFKFDLGTGINTIKSERPISMLQWHKVLLTRTGRQGSLQVDGDAPITLTSKGGYSQLSLPLNLYLGGVPSPKELASAAEVQNSFVGCVQKLVINGKIVKLVEQALSGVNINNCNHVCNEKPCSNGGTCFPVLGSYSCKCAVGYTGPSCNTEIVDMITKPMFMGTSYLHYVNEHILTRFRGQSLQMTLTFRALSPFGLILWAGSRVVDTSSDYFVLGLYDGHIRLDYNLGSGPVSLFYNHSRMDDGYWHQIKIVRFKQRGSMTINDTRTVTAVSPGPLKELNIPNELFLGGMPDIGRFNAGVYETGLMGCLSSFTLDTNYEIQFLPMAATGINIQPCV